MYPAPELKDEPVGIAVGVLFTILSVGAGLDAVTTRIWISGDRLSLRDHFLRIRSFKFSEIRSVTFVPGELFEIHLTSKQRIRFPAGSKNLDRISETLLAHIKIGEYDTWQATGANTTISAAHPATRSPSTTRTAC